MNDRLFTSSGLCVDIVPARLYRNGRSRSRRGFEPPALMGCRVPIALMAGARSRVEVSIASMVGHAYELVFVLLRGRGTAAALAFDPVGEHAQTALRLARERGCLDIAITDGRATEVVRCMTGNPMAEVLSRSAGRSAPVGPDEMAVCVRRFLEWLDTPQALEELGVRLDAWVEQPQVVLSLFVEESMAQRFVAERALS